MIPVSNDFYAGIVPPGVIMLTQPCNCGMVPYAHTIKEYHVIFFEGLDFWTLTNWSGQISSFPLLHVDTWLSMNQPMGKAGVGVFGQVKAGNSGRGSQGLGGLSMMFNPSDAVWLNAWAHNMNRTNYDWHCGYELWLR